MNVLKLPDQKIINTLNSFAVPLLLFGWQMNGK